MPIKYVKLHVAVTQGETKDQTHDVGNELRKAWKALDYHYRYH